MTRRLLNHQFFIMISGIALISLMAAGGTASANEAKIVNEKQIGPRVIELTISTPAFDVPTKVHVDLPTGYADNPSRKWPVSYFLAGIMNTYASFNEVVDGVELTKGFPAIVVSPNGDSGFWSDWYNNGKFGTPKYETYVINQLIPLIDERFRTFGDRAHRAIAGASMGGYGAMMLAARHPDLFATAASISGATDSNLPTIGTVLSLSPTFQGGPVDAIYGPRATQEVLWRGHNPVDLADNLRSLKLQVRSANGVLDTSIGEDPLSADTASCVVEAGVYQGSLSFKDKLEQLQIPHLWKDYGNGCHTTPNFKREVIDTLEVFKRQLTNPSPKPETFDYRSIESEFSVWGWNVKTDPERASQFLQMSTVGHQGLTLAGSGTTRVISPPIFADATRVELQNALPKVAVPDSRGRIRFTVDLGPPDTSQQFTLGTVIRPVSRTVTLLPQRRNTAAKKCVVPKVVGLRLTRARVRLRRAHCRLGRVKGKRKASARVVKQWPKARTTRPARAKVRVVLR